ncbi:hypothetical protein AKJ37_01745 [candidate division MSBL1 archaeon SCGC-AAA259I09]|uniref:Uncharacterized protein n=1 Tax=candidate division MSBL1 archaeon SCGC-AAA259I09 TaxID=1698267 RepID=A0A133UV49_9EURY|nr:hypothetical protein AKJ37_01745 [candidate division MSBL1 archaeon SCGC-AAA259I09]
MQAQKEISHKLKRKLGNPSILDVATGTGVPEGERMEGIVIIFRTFLSPLPIKQTDLRTKSAGA